MKRLLAALVSLCLVFGAGWTAAAANITMAGSTTVLVLAEELAKAYMEKHPDVRISVQGGGSGTGIQNARAGVVDIGMSSRNLKPEEKEYGLTEWVIAKDGIAVVANRTVSANNLTLEQLKAIFTGKITDWSEVGGRKGRIIVVNREAGSGTRGAFQEIALDGEEFAGKALIGNGNGVVHQMVATTPNSIGYISLGYLSNRVKPLKIEGVQVSLETIRSGEYKVARPLLLLTKGEFRPEVKDFLEFVLSSEGQKIVAARYIPVSD